MRENAELPELLRELNKWGALYAGLSNGQITPRKIVGTGYNNARQVANKYLSGELNKVIELVCVKLRDEKREN